MPAQQLALAAEQHQPYLSVNTVFAPQDTVAEFSGCAELQAVSISIYIFFCLYVLNLSCRWLTVDVLLGRGRSRRGLVMCP